MNAYQKGKAAGADGKLRTACPFPAWTSDGRAWLVGWKEAANFQSNVAAYFKVKG